MKRKINFNVISNTWASMSIQKHKEKKKKSRRYQDKDNKAIMAINDRKRKRYI